MGRDSSPQGEDYDREVLVELQDPISISAGPPKYLAAAANSKESPKVRRGVARYFDGPERIRLRRQRKTDDPRCRGQRNQDTKNTNAETKPLAFAAAA